MPLAANQQVAVRVTRLPAPAPAGGPLRGIISAVNGTATVLWNNGSQVASIVLVTLDLITSTGAETEAARLAGRRVSINNPAGQTNWGHGTVRDVYARQTNAEGVATIIALVQFDSGDSIEVTSSTCVVVT